MKTRIVRIGNSRGIRIPKPLLKEAGLGDEVELTSRRGALLIRRAGRPRDGWADAFRQMAKRGDDALFTDIPPTLSDWDDKEWQWR